MNANKECLFCRIIRKEIPADIVFQNDQVLAFRDISPQAPVHVLVIPKKHIASLNEILAEDRGVLGELQESIRLLADTLHVAKTGYRVVMNCGTDAGQAVGHLHYHLIGGRKFSWPPG